MSLFKLASRLDVYVRTVSRLHHRAPYRYLPYALGFWARCAATIRKRCYNEADLSLWHAMPFAAASSKLDRKLANCTKIIGKVVSH